MLDAIIGGTMGVALSAAARALGIPGDVRRHDAEVVDHDDGLATWVADRDHRLRRDCKAIRDNLGPRPPAPPFDDPGALYQYEQEAQEADGAIANAKANALHEYRDQARRVRLDVASIMAAEGWAHRVYRRAGRRPPVSLKTPENATPVLDAWRKPSAMSEGHQVWPDDATKRTLHDAISTMPVTGP